ncbi:G-type lectin S-receptor-like serine/threonine-protein kinase At4g27290 [Diospyros lotus]|uniref:G-type lectin S-receptor-like serine/threonine-protein kinase At4g27290 n=1 Tax=Diospyros lotus TaxID=55363 RepID=UPI002256AA47|nr:G-type lectin S-receptor-like serine/threonine-protein kinase At4g27290 [Diospyros lotus]
MPASMDPLNLLLLLSSLFSISVFAFAADTINKTHSLADGQTLVSSGGNFELGFFTPGVSKYRYVGVWYRKISAKTVIWVANRDAPLPDNSGSLNLTEQGILLLLDGSNKVVWSTNTSTSPKNPVAQLLDTGNLVVREADDENSDHCFWQGFDYPTDTLLPEMKMGLNLTTGWESHLTAWRSKDDPGKSDFTFRCDIRGYPQLILSNGSLELFRMGSWNGLQFTGTPHLKPNSIYSFGLVMKKHEIYYRYHLLSSVVSRFTLTQNGVMQRYTWVDRSQQWMPYLRAPADDCDQFKLCGPYGSCNIKYMPVCRCLVKFVPKNQGIWDSGDWSNGCDRKVPIKDCRSKVGFLKYSRYKLPDTRNSWYDRTMTLNQCRDKCLNNCSCTAYSNLDVRNGGTGCLLWFDELVDMREVSEDGQDIYIRMVSSELDGDGGFSGTKRNIVIVILALFIGLLAGLSLKLHLRKKKKKKSHKRIEGSIIPNTGQGYTDKSEKDDLELPSFDLATIASATNNFSSNNKLGEGGFGPVYKGMLEGGQEIAAKRLSKHSSQGLDEFKNEVICIAKLQHRNLVKLLGCCIGGGEKMLIYEYLPNKSLDYFIFHQLQSRQLDWPKRFNIINGIARGVLYLHQDSRLRIIHRDLKASNILLDSEMNPKISDFGMAKSLRENETQANTSRVVGTHGYMSPEYVVDGLFSIKSDVFSFGVLVVEILSGKRNRGFFHPDHHLNLLGHAWRLFQEDRSMEMIDEPLRESCYLSEVMRSIHVGLLCVQRSPDDRPSMAAVVLMLGSDGALPEPKQPGFFTERNPLDVISSSTQEGSASANEITMTLLSAR